MTRKRNPICSDLRLQDYVRPLTAAADPVLAQLWGNERDAAYDRQPRQLAGSRSKGSVNLT